MKNRFLILFLIELISNSVFAGYFMSCHVRPAVVSIKNMLQWAKGYSDPNCDPSDDCVELDHYPEMAQGSHGTCWRMAATNVLRHAISKQKGICIDQVSPFSFKGGYGDRLNFAIKENCRLENVEHCMGGYKDEEGKFHCTKLEKYQNRYCDSEAGHSINALSAVNKQKGRLHIAPTYIFSCNSEAELMKMLTERGKTQCEVSKPWKLLTREGGIELNAQVVSGICSVFYEHGKYQDKDQTFTELIENAEHFDPNIREALQISLMPEPALSSKYHFEYLASDLKYEYEGLNNYSNEEKYARLRTALEKTRLPLILDTEGSREIGAFVLGLSWIPSGIRAEIVGATCGHVVTMTAARLRSNDEKQIFIEDSDGIFTGWRGLEAMGLIRGYIWVQLP